MCEWWRFTEVEGKWYSIIEERERNWKRAADLVDYQNYTLSAQERENRQRYEYLSVTHNVLWIKLFETPNAVVETALAAEDDLGGYRFGDFLVLLREMTQKRKENQGDSQISKVVTAFFTRGDHKRLIRAAASHLALWLEWTTEEKLLRDNVPMSKEEAKEAIANRAKVMSDYVKALLPYANEVDNEFRNMAYMDTNNQLKVATKLARCIMQAAAVAIEEQARWVVGTKSGTERESEWAAIVNDGILSVLDANE